MELLRELYLEAQQLDDQNIVDNVETLVSEVRGLSKDAYTFDASNNDLFIEFGVLEKLKAISVNSFLNSPELCLPHYALAFHIVSVNVSNLPDVVLFPPDSEADPLTHNQLQCADSLD